MKKKGYVHLVAGGADSGKTTYIKSWLNKLPGRTDIIVYDVRNEYPSKISVYCAFDEFLKKIKGVQNTVIVIEEATLFLKHTALKDDFLFKLTGKSHDGNYFFLPFHSLRKIPLNVYDLSDYLTLFKTNDNDEILNKFDDYRIKYLYYDVHGSLKPHYNCTLII